MPDGTTSVSGPTASLGAHLELDLALGALFGSRVRTLIRAGESLRRAAPADLHGALETIAGDRTVRPQMRRLAADLAGRVAKTMHRRPPPRPEEDEQPSRAAR